MTRMDDLREEFTIKFGIPTDPRYFGGLRNVQPAAEPSGDRIRLTICSRNHPWPTTYVGGRCRVGVDILSHRLSLESVVDGWLKRRTKR